MSKKKHKYKQNNQSFPGYDNTWNPNTAQTFDTPDGQGYGNPGMDNGYGSQGFGQNTHAQAQAFNGYAQNPAGSGNGFQNGAFPNAGAQSGSHSAWQSLGLSGLFGGNRQTEQFILGLLLGGAAAYVLGDPEKRAQLIRMGMKLYAGVAGSFEEFKEQIADLKAEVAAGQDNPEE